MTQLHAAARVVTLIVATLPQKDQALAPHDVANHARGRLPSPNLDPIRHGVLRPSPARRFVPGTRTAFVTVPDHGAVPLELQR